MKKILLNAHRGGAFSGENHHKFFLGHMIVFRMHLNKSEEYIKKSKKVISACGILCESQPKIKRWRRMALDELNRVRDDMQHSRLMYRDLLTHAQRRLNTVRKKAHDQAKAAREALTECAAGGLT
ncbi:hypothetical protein O0L34_g16943 [Tuta absoluta]|nr:hypothetical protein O0L34_g16943 [Tuta absoluta]